MSTVQIRSSQRDPVTRLFLTIAGVATIASVIGVWRIAREAPAPLRSAMARAGGTEMVAIFIGSADCKGSKLPGFPDTQHRVFDALRQAADSQHIHFTRIGVAVDADVNVGKRSLEEFGPFDATVVGGGWLNPLAVTYIWRDNPGRSDIPQIVVLRRHITKNTQGFAVTADSIIGRLVGMDEMQRWLDRQPKVDAGGS